MGGKDLTPWPPCLRFALRVSSAINSATQLGHDRPRVHEHFKPEIRERKRKERLRVAPVDRTNLASSIARYFTCNSLTKMTLKILLHTTPSLDIER